MDPKLQRIVAAWPSLPESIRCELFALAEAHAQDPADGAGADRDRPG